MPQDALEPGLRDELITEELGVLVKAAVDRAESKVLEPSEALERLGKHLLRVAQRLRVPSDKEKLAETTALVNTAIEALGKDFQGDRVEAPARVLRGVRPTSGLAQHSLPAHPMIPLTSSELLVNGANEPSFGTVLLEELRCATDVDLICAFVGFTGFEPLKNEFRALIERGGQVRVITSTYLGSTSAKALDELVALGAEVRVNYQGQTTKLHAKAWLFRRPGELDTAFVGSSNLSEAALYSGLEWNVRLARADAPRVFNRIQNTFDSYWYAPAYERYGLEDRERLDMALFAAKGYAANAISKQAQLTIDQYKKQLSDAYEQLHLMAKPHQQKVLDTLSLRRETFDEHRHLVVAATGTGKTVMAALDYARLCEVGQPRPRLLFVAHREQILTQALSTFRNALRDPDFGDMLTGDDAPSNDAHVFAMVQTLHNRLSQIPPESYDVIYIDEAHHGAALSWQTVIKHFTPREIVGLTATPERADGVGIAQLFGGEYTTELRLWEAVDDQLLVPFQYVGVDDGTDLRSVAWHKGDYATGALSALYTGDHERVRRTVDALDRWVESARNMRALGFCVTVAHATFMAEQFTKLGIQADYLSGEHDVSHRQAVLSKLSGGELQVVFSVDVLGEGVDIPDVDTLLLLRPTQSPVLFAQQLGRGLRTSPGKTRCLVLDLIGQHRAEYRLEERYEALVDSSRGSVEEQLALDFPFLPAGCSINLERVAKERVLSALKAVAAQPGLKHLTKDLVALGSVSLEVFLTSTGRQIEQFYRTEGRTLSWTRLQRAAGTIEAPPEPSTSELKQEEARLLKRIGYLQHVTDSLRADVWSEWLKSSAPPDSSEFTLLHRRLAIQLMHGLLLQPPTLDTGFEILWNHRSVRDEIAELLLLTRPMVDASPAPLRGLEDVPIMAHARYTRAEVLAATGVSGIDRMVVQQSGVEFVQSSGSQLMFVTLHKDNARFSSTTQYKDHAITRDLFHWESPNSWRQQTPAMQRCIGAGPEGSQHRLLFVRERDIGAIEGTFRCFGQVDLQGELEGDRPVALTWQLRQPLPEILFEAATLLLAS